MSTDPYRAHPRVRIFESMLKDVTYKYGKPLPATRENLRKVAAGEL